MIRIRPFHVSESWTMRRIMHDAVRTGAAGRYSAEQRAAWSPSATPPEGWNDRLADHITLVAEEVTPEADVPVGFGTIRRDGHLDLFFVAPAQMGKGAAGQLYDALIAAVAIHRPERLTARASLYARPFLERRGWIVTEALDIEREGIALPCFEMEREIAGAANVA